MSGIDGGAIPICMILFFFFFIKKPLHSHNRLIIRVCYQFTTVVYCGLWLDVCVWRQRTFLYFISHTCEHIHLNNECDMWVVECRVRGINIMTIDWRKSSKLHKLEIIFSFCFERITYIYGGEFVHSRNCIHPKNIKIILK